MQTLFDRLGGATAVDAAVERFYGKVLADTRINRFFVGVDMKRQASHQKQFLTYAFGGSPNYPGNALRVTHRRLVKEMGLTDTHFDAVIEDLAATLREMGVAEDLIAEAGHIAATTRDDVLDREASA